LIINLGAYTNKSYQGMAIYLLKTLAGHRKIRTTASYLQQSWPVEGSCRVGLIDLEFGVDPGIQFPRQRSNCNSHKS